jgi:archaellum component FlaC
MEVQIITKEDVKDMILSTLSEEINPTLWCENNSLRMDIKDLQEQVEILRANVKQLKKITGWSCGYDDNNWDIDKSLTKRLGDLEYEVNPNKMR